MLLFFCHFLLTGSTHYTKTPSCHEFTCYSKRTLFKRIYAVWTKIKSSTKLFLGKNAKSKSCSSYHCFLFRQTSDDSDRVYGKWIFRYVFKGRYKTHLII